MSTWTYYECHSHTPPISSSSEIGQHTYDIPRSQKLLAEREDVLKAVDLLGEIPQVDDIFDQARISFIHQHPHCDIHIIDEYGQDRTDYTEDEA